MVRAPWTSRPPGAPIRRSRLDSKKTSVDSALRRRHERPLLHEQPTLVVRFRFTPDAYIWAIFRHGATAPLTSSTQI